MQYILKMSCALLIALPLSNMTHGQALADAEVSTATNATAAKTSGEQAPGALAHEDLDATLWMQTSSEYRAACVQTFRAAIYQLGKALVDPNATAAVEQRAAMPQASSKELLPAVILDVDETVLDNSAYQAHLIETGQQFSPTIWSEWISDAPSLPIPGVREFIDACRAAKVKVFFVTNRSTNDRAATLTNLKKYGLMPQESDGQTLLCKGDQETWTSDKTTRRTYIAQLHRILLIIGDDLNDFVSVGVKPTPSARRTIAEQHDDMWGSKWFVIPNPTYGGWERAVHGWQDASSRDTKLKLKRDLLRLAPPGQM